jgi:hypothetical protein
MYWIYRAWPTRERNHSVLKPSLHSLPKSFALEAICSREAVTNALKGDYYWSAQTVKTGQAFFLIIVVDAFQVSNFLSAFSKFEMKPLNGRWTDDGCHSSRHKDFA